MSRTTKQEVLELFQDRNFQDRKKEILALQRDISTARGVIADGKKRYIKQRLRLRSKKAAENPFAALEGYNTREDIRNDYGWEFISEAEMDRLMLLWDAREASKAADGMFEDRVTAMLDLALASVGEQFLDEIREFLNLERRMDADAERIALENRQREWDRKYGGGL